MAKFYITTSIPYVNARPHIGHALEFVQADAIARYKKINGHGAFLTTGTDENSLKSVISAQKLGISAEELCRSNSKLFKDMSSAVGLSYDAFVRTSVDKEHMKTVQEFWAKCSESGDIYKKKYGGLYCVGCELFYTEGELIGGLCPEHHTKPEFVEEENYFFRLSKYEKRVMDAIEGNAVQILPQERRAEVINFIKSGLEDFSVSRSVERAHGWGLHVPGDDTQVIYVWFDALVSYLTGAGFSRDKDLFRRLWPADIHVIGKGIVRFHAVYWIAMLMSAGVELPKSILVHGYVTVDGQKMSKSIGNVVDPIAISAKYGQDAVRYYLLKEISTFQDGDFSEKALKDALNNELAGNLGNFINRTFTFIGSRMGGSIKELEMDEGRLVIDEAGKIAAEVDGLMARCQLGMALMKIMEISNIGNRYLQSNEPWKLADVDERAAREVLFACATLCRMIGILVYPFMPGAAERMLGYIGEKPSGYGKAVEIPASFSIKEHGILFKKIE